MFELFLLLLLSFEDDLDPLLLSLFQNRIDGIDRFCGCEYLAVDIGIDIEIGQAVVLDDLLKRTGDMKVSNIFK